MLLLDWIKNFHKVIENTDGGAAPTMDIFKVCNYSTDASSDLVLAVKDVLQTYTEAVASVLHYKNGSTSPTINISLNNGSNFTSGITGSMGKHVMANFKSMPKLKNKLFFSGGSRSFMMSISEHGKIPLQMKPLIITLIPLTISSCSFGVDISCKNIKRDL